MFISLYLLMFTIFVSHIINVKLLSNKIEHCDKFEINKNICKNKRINELEKRFILYNVNQAEGFNLRRDVYVRLATFVQQLNKFDKQYQWNLVLPPWGNLYHWNRFHTDTPHQLPWGTFFDIESLRKYIPVLEMYEFIKDYSVKDNKIIIDCLFHIENDKSMFKTGIFRDKNYETDCKEYFLPDNLSIDKEMHQYFWGYSNITASQIKCIIFHGTVLSLEKNLRTDLCKTTMFNHMEIPLHFTYGSAEYWRARRSMRYILELYKLADKFRIQNLNSTNNHDKITVYQDWTIKNNHRNALGGPYISVHFRRQDFLNGREHLFPTVKVAAAQIQKVLNLLNLNTVFVATDANMKEYNQMKYELKGYRIIRYLPSDSIKSKFKEGGIAIIDQIICSHSRYFLGTKGSTFTYRIQEDREILGFPVNTTFNFLCSKNSECNSDHVWEILWE